MSERLDHSLQLEDGGEQAASSPTARIQVRFHLHITPRKEEFSPKLLLADISLA